jgi:hypothetical protein
MLCLGEECTSALFMSFSATRGANLFRLPRDERLMDLVLGFVGRFAEEYGEGRKEPEKNFWWGGEWEDEYVRAQKNHADKRGGSRGETP